MTTATVICECGLSYSASDVEESEAIEFANLQRRACAVTVEHSTRVAMKREMEQQERMQYVRGCVRAVEL
jgi:hypothetical protein